MVRTLAWLLHDYYSLPPLGAIRAVDGWVLNKQDNINATFVGYYSPLYTKGSDEESIDADSTPVTKGFLTSLFDSLKANLQDLRKDISQELQDLRTELTSLGEGLWTRRE
ncbi:hypothetical protein NDU88_001020 [Pleurodeles waltl]|uniref:Uncharacterized protein n=1 Tax=Pleurodeles waltl TaxID=8319 RepID=A0AAV7TIY5_PLEWA|nr:hypothetical protein NDU88_001020 [Pleurodeles waltl]